MDKVPDNTAAPGAADVQPHGRPPELPPLRSLWQLPALAAGVLLLVAGLAGLLLSSPRIDLAPFLSRASELSERGEYERALGVLNDRIGPQLDQLTPEQARTFRVLRARLLYLGQREAGIDHEANHRNILDEYAAAEGAGAALEPKDLAFMCETHVALGQMVQALERARSLPPEEGEYRRKLFKRIVDKELARVTGDPEATLALLTEFAGEPGLTATDRAWALARQAEVLLRRGHVEGAIGRLVREMPRVMAADPETVGELFLLLGRAYMDSGAVQEAARQLEQAAARLAEDDPKRGRAMVLLARIDAQAGELAEARGKLTAVAEAFTAETVRVPALLSLGQVLFLLGEFEASTEAYREVVVSVASGRSGPEVRAWDVARELLARQADRSLAGDFEAAFQYAELAGRLYTPESAPAEVLLGLARAHRGKAEDLAAGADIQDMDPAMRSQVRAHFAAGGDFFGRHAERVLAQDDGAYAASLWLAADSFDRAGDQEAAIRLWHEYVRGFPEDPLQSEARFRLAQAHQSRGDYELAAQTYRRLVEDLGVFADRSHVPLAQSLLAEGGQENESEAERLLLRVVEGRIGGPETAEYRDALLALAGLRMRADDFAGAAARLEEAVVRFESWPGIAGVRYRLADAYRHDALAIAERLGDAMPDDERRALEQTRAERLARAGELFESVRRELEAQDQRRMGALERIQLRNSYFYIADCAFDLGDHDGAIRRYTTATERYPTDPSSLVAMTQIVSAHVARGDLDRAAAANERARRFYESMPASAWDDPQLPFGRREWQRWLDSLALLAAEPSGSGRTAGVGSER